LKLTNLDRRIRCPSPGYASWRPRIARAPGPFRFLASAGGGVGISSLVPTAPVQPEVSNWDTTGHSQACPPGIPCQFDGF